MSILIKGISSLKDGLYQIQDGKIHAYKGKGGKTEGYDLIEVPTPHGRLVDADALKATFCAECNHTITCEDCDIDYHIGRLAPTIIEAEEGEA